MTSAFGVRERYGNAEFLLMRLAFALVIARSFLDREFFAAQPYPNGLAHWIDLSVISLDPVALAVRGMLVAALAVYAAGIAVPHATGVLLILTVWIGTLANSQGAISHGHQIIPLVLLGQTAAHLRFALARRALPASALPVGVRVQDLVVHHSQQMIAAVYMTAGITKILRSRGRWILDLPDIAVEIVKTHAQAFHNHLEPGLVERGDQLANAILAHPHLLRLVLSGGLALELCAFFALRGRAAAFAVGSALVMMHGGIEFLMMLRFRDNQLVVLIFLVNLPFLLVRAFQFAWPRWRPWSSA